MNDAGVNGARLDVLAGLQIPGILVEGGFLSNAAEAARIATPEYRQGLADALAGGIRNFRTALLAGARSQGRGQ